MAGGLQPLGMTQGKTDANGALIVTIAAGSTPVFGLTTITVDGLITTSTDGLIVQDTTAATLAVPVQISPRVRLSGTAWDTDDTVSRTVSFFTEVLGVSAATVSGIYKIGFINPVSAALTYPLTLTSAGLLTMLAGVTGTVGTFTTSLISPAWIPAGGTAAVTGALTVSTTANVTTSVTSPTFFVGSNSWTSSSTDIVASGGIRSTSNMAVGQTGLFLWSNRTVLDVATIDGALRITNNAQSAGATIVSSAAQLWVKAQDGTSDTATLKVNVVNPTGKYQINGVDGASGTGTVISAITVVNGLVTAITVA